MLIVLEKYFMWEKKCNEKIEQCITELRKINNNFKKI